MSLKSFHIIFIIISSLMMAYFSYWSVINWLNYKDGSYMLYGVLSIISFILLLFYSKKFMDKYKEITS
jgi:UDP-N-acetylmuramyl pentapeptide phosphotransferase/UDP-N-acetylglucosamine-1-phosphate transferase